MTLYDETFGRDAMGRSPYSIRLDDDLRQSLEREAAIEAALQNADRGAFISAEAMNDWIDSWDTDEELSAPTPDITPDPA